MIAIINGGSSIAMLDSKNKSDKRPPLISEFVSFGSVLGASLGYNMMEDAVEYMIGSQKDKSSMNHQSLYIHH